GADHLGEPLAPPRPRRAAGRGAGAPTRLPPRPGADDDRGDPGEPSLERLGGGPPPRPLPGRPLEEDQDPSAPPPPPDPRPPLAPAALRCTRPTGCALTGGRTRSPGRMLGSVWSRGRPPPRPQ